MSSKVVNHFVILVYHALINACSHIIRFVDGEDYMSAVADAIIGAKSEVCITDWQYVNL